ncbi:MAG: hypothetical protein ACLT16_20170 [[Clostridium] innocuum]
MKKDPAYCRHHTGGCHRPSLSHLGTKGWRATYRELLTHLMNRRARLTNNENRVIYHCHCPNVIALTFLLPLKSEIITREI